MLPAMINWGWDCGPPDDNKSCIFGSVVKDSAPFAPSLFCVISSKAFATSLVLSPLSSSLARLAGGGCGKYSTNEAGRVTTIRSL